MHTPRPPDTTARLEAPPLSAVPPVRAGTLALRPITLLLLALATSLLQLGTYLLRARAPDLRTAYDSLVNWDSNWYLIIAEHGYYSTVPPLAQRPDLANVAFFPGYPLLGRYVSHALGVELRTGLLIAAQACAVPFWAFFYALAARLTCSRRALALGALFVGCFPTAYYLQSAYSESLFTSSLLAFLFFSTRPHPGVLGASVSGFVMTATRIVGLPLALVGAAHAVLRHAPRLPPLRLVVRHAVISACSLAGAGAFFLFCQLKWGHWNLYMWTQEVGWGLSPDYLAVFRGSSWTQWHMPLNWDPFFTQPLEASQLATSLSLWGFVAIAALEVVLRLGFGVRGALARAPYYMAALGLEFISVSGLVRLEFQSMVRYVFPVHVLLVLAQLALWSRVPPRLYAMRFALGALACGLSLYLLLVQLHFMGRTSQGLWVS